MSIVDILKRVEVSYNALRENKPDISLCYNGEYMYFEDVTQNDVAVSPELLWVNLEALDDMELNSVIVDLFNNVTLSRKFILPSKFQIGVSVKLSLSKYKDDFEAKILAVHFYEGKVKYDLEIPIEGETPTRIYNIDSVFVLPTE